MIFERNWKSKKLVIYSDFSSGDICQLKKRNPPKTKSKTTTTQKCYQIVSWKWITGTKTPIRHIRVKGTVENETQRIENYTWKVEDRVWQIKAIQIIESLKKVR